MCKIGDILRSHCSILVNFKTNRTLFEWALGQHRQRVRVGRSRWDLPANWIKS